MTWIIIANGGIYYLLSLPSMDALNSNESLQPFYNRGTVQMLQVKAFKSGLNLNSFNDFFSFREVCQ